MDPISTIALVNALLTGLENLLPHLQTLRNDGLITPDQQAQLLEKYESLKTRADDQFSGPEWTVD